MTVITDTWTAIIIIVILITIISLIHHVMQLSRKSTRVERQLRVVECSVLIAFG